MTSIINLNHYIKYIVGNEKLFGSVDAISDIEDIRDQSIAVYAPTKEGKPGHVVFVEYVERDSTGKPINIYFTDANGLTDLNRGQFDYGYDGVIQKVTFQKFKGQFAEKLIGYIIPKDVIATQS